MKKKIPTKLLPKGARGKGKEKVNPFEFVSAKKKFPILGVKTKHAKKNVVQARTEALEKRKKTLLVEYKNLGKSNAFIDRRFGEHVEGVSEEDKALMRLQRQRLKESRGAKFNLGGGEDEGLTHLGESLGEGLGGFGDDRSDDEGEDLDPELTARLHFGGGDDGEELFQRARPSGASGEEEGRGEGQPSTAARPKTKKEVMEEIIAKSKLYKALKKKQREEDDDKLAELDEQFTAVMRAGVGLVRRDKKKDLRGFLKEEDRLDALADPSAKEYDRLTRQLAQEARAAQPGDRTRSLEELADQERRRLERLERDRVRRMGASGDDDEDQLGVAPVVEGGFRGRREKRKRAEMEGGSGSDEESEGEEEGSGSEGESGSGEEEDDDLIPAGNALEQRRREQAMGDHPLQEKFRETMMRLMEKKGLAAKIAPQEEDDEEEEEGSDEEAGSSGEEEGSEGEGSSGEEDGEERSDDEDEVEEGEEDEEEEEDVPAAAPASVAKAAEAKPQGKGAIPPPPPPPRDGSAEPEGPQDLPYILPLPRDYDALRRLLDGVEPRHVAAAVSRVLGSNKAALARDGRKGLQSLYGMLLQYFIDVAGRGQGTERLDALLPSFLELTAEVPLYAATAFRARLDKLREQLLRQEKGGEGADGPGSTWIGPRGLCLLQLAASIFPPSDTRHPVLTPAALLMGGFLTLGRLAAPVDLARGLVLAGLATRLAAPAERLVPEIPLFLGTALKFIAQELASSGAAAANLEPQRLPLASLLAADPQDARLQGPQFLVSAAGAVSDQLARFSAIVEGLPAATQLLAPAVAALKEAAGGKGVSKALSTRLSAARSKLEAASAACDARRKPLSRLRPTAPAVKQYNPRVEDADGPFALNKDYDPDRVRAEEKRLKRQVAKETRATMRELRRDSEFLGVERMKEREQASASRDAKQKAALSFLQGQQSDMRSGGQKDMNWKKNLKRNRIS